MQLGLPTNYLKMLMAVLFTIALVVNNIAPSAERRKKANVK
jgi:putative ABC transport system permease protein